MMPSQRAVNQRRFTRVFTDAAWAYRQHVLVHEAAIEQFSNHKTRAARGLELVHIGAAVGINMRQQRHDV